MVREFHDDDGKVHHKAFQAWRRANPGGFFLTFATKAKVNLHGAACHHSGSGTWLAEADGRNSLTRERKALATSEKELARWASRHGLDVHVCKHCLRDGLLEGTYAEAPTTKASAELTAREGALKESWALSRSRSATLRRAALVRSRGTCESCEVDFSKLLGGAGVAVLEVHHRNQLSRNSAPVVTSVSDLAVLCANCHALVHAKSGKPLAVQKLRKALSVAQGEA